MNNVDHNPIPPPTWQPAHLPSTPPGPELHIWRIWRDQLPEHPQLLSPQELARAAALTDPQHQRRQRATQAAVRSLLAGHLQCEPDQLQFVRSEQGKPYLSQQPLSFNLSHSGELALLAVSAGGEVGIDLEPLQPRPHLPAICRRLFDDDTAQEIEQLSGTALTERFFWHWTRFEAQQKMTGAGIFGHRQLPAHQLLSFQPHSGWQAAVALQGEDSLQVRFLDYRP